MDQFREACQQFELRCPFCGETRQIYQTSTGWHCDVCAKDWKEPAGQLQTDPPGEHVAARGSRLW